MTAREADWSVQTLNASTEAKTREASLCKTNVETKKRNVDAV